MKVLSILISRSDSEVNCSSSSHCDVLLPSQHVEGHVCSIIHLYKCCIPESSASPESQCRLQMAVYWKTQQSITKAEVWDSCFLECQSDTRDRFRTRSDTISSLYIRKRSSPLVYNAA